MILQQLAVPVVLAPLAGGPSTPELAAAVSNAGGLGFLAAGYLTGTTLGDRIAQTRKLTTAPFGVNVFVPGSAADPAAVAAVAAHASSLAADALRAGVALGTARFEDDDWAAKIDLLTASPVPVVSFTFGCPPADVIGRLQDAGSEVWVSVTRPAEAQEAAAAGADVLVVQGAEAGGHRAGFRDDPADDVVDGIGLLSLLQLAAAQATGARASGAQASGAQASGAQASGARASGAQAASSTRPDGTALSNIPAGLPLVAAGGIMNGAAIAAVLAAGAAAAQLGTAFLRCPEAGTADVQRQALAGAAPTVMTRAFTGRLARGIRNAFTDSHSAAAPSAYPEVHHLTAPLRQAGRAAGNAEVVNLWAGQAYQLGRERPAGELVTELAEEARAAAAQLSGRLTAVAPAPRARGK